MHLTCWDPDVECECACACVEKEIERHGRHTARNALAYLCMILWQAHERPRNLQGSDEI
jgi:hypothetical protein